MEKRKIDIAVISDVHLGTHGCRVQELSRYLSTIDPTTLVLNGDIIDTWQYNKKFWPNSHMQIVKQIASMLSRNVKVFYITGNHDKVLSRYHNFSLGDFHIKSNLLLKHPNGDTSWILHGDVFDVNMQNSKWFASLGTPGFNIMLYINNCVNYIKKKTGVERISMSKKIKRSEKDAEKIINSFRNAAAEIAIRKGYQHILSGHIHQPEKQVIKNKQGEVLYLNSGDWVEHLTALEYNYNEWNVYQYQQDPLVHELNDSFYLDEATYLQTTELFKMMLKDFQS